MYIFLEMLKEIKKAIFMLGGSLLGFNGGTLLEGIISSSKWYKKLGHDYWLRQLEKEEVECLK